MLNVQLDFEVNRSDLHEHRTVEAQLVMLAYETGVVAPGMN